MVEGQVEPQEATRVGAMLREQRVQSGLNVAEVSGFLRIRAAYVQAIEAGRFEVLPGPAYAAGFVRTYAEFLGLDPAEVARRFQAETRVAPRIAPLAFPVPDAETGTPKAGIMLVGAVIALVAYGGWYLTSSDRPEVSELAVQAVDQPGSTAAIQAVPAGSALSGATTPEAGGAAVIPVLPGSPRPGPAPSAPAQPAPGEMAAAGAPQPPMTAAGGANPSSPSPAPASPADAPVQALDEGAPPVPPASPLSGTATTAMAAEPPAGGMASSADPAARIVLRAKSDSWVEVRDPQSNSLLVARLLRSGDVYNVPDRPGLRMVTGNAGGLIVVVDGESMGPLGKEGAVRRGIPLEPDALRRVSQGGPSQ